MRSRAANWIPARVKRSNIEEAATSPSRWRRVAMKITSARTGILDTQEAYAISLAENGEGPSAMLEPSKKRRMKSDQGCLALYRAELCPRLTPRPAGFEPTTSRLQDDNPRSTTRRKQCWMKSAEAVGSMFEIGNASTTTQQKRMSDENDAAPASTRRTELRQPDKEKMPEAALRVKSGRSRPSMQELLHRNRPHRSCPYPLDPRS